MMRRAPKASQTTSRKGVKSAGFHFAQSASVTIPESLQYTFGRAARFRRSASQGESTPSLISGLAMWSGRGLRSGRASCGRPEGGAGR
jgi:hypothetical protein